MYISAKEKMLPFTMSLRSIVKNKFLTIFTGIFAVLILVMNIIADIKINFTSRMIDVQMLYMLTIVIYSILAIILYSYLSARLFIYDVRDNYHKIELRYGYSAFNIYFSRILLILLLILSICVWQVILAVIFYFSNGMDSQLFAYKFYFIPIGWVIIISIMSVFISLLFSIFFTERVGVSLTPIFLIIIILISIVFPIYGKPELGKTSNFNRNGTSIITIAYSSDQYIYEGLQLKIEYDVNKIMHSGNCDKIMHWFKSEFNDETDLNAITDKFINSPDNADFKKPFTIATRDITYKVVHPGTENINYKLFAKQAYLSLKNANLNNLFINIMINYYHNYSLYDSLKDGMLVYSYNSQNINNWDTYIESQLVYMMAKSYLNFEYGKTDSFDAMIFDSKVMQELSKKIYSSYFYNPFSQISSMFYGVNYYDQFLGSIIDSNGIFPFGSNPNLDINFDDTNANSLTKNSCSAPKVSTSYPSVNVLIKNFKIKTNFPIEVIYAVYAFFMLAVIGVIYFWFNKRIIK